MDNDPRLMTKKHQGLPRGGYAAFMASLLEGIPMKTEWDFLKRREEMGFRRGLIFTGPIDEYFDFSLGRLQYRGQRREHTHLEEVELAQPCGQVNNPHPDQGDHIRDIEWKHMMEEEARKGIQGTVLTREVPFDPTDPNDFEYPFPSSENRTRYEGYRELAGAEEKVLICGRLGEYRYYDMDQAIGRAMHLAQGLLD
jgi:UDP-galactopyranose mutase